MNALHNAPWHTQRQALDVKASAPAMRARTKQKCQCRHSTDIDFVVRALESRASDLWHSGHPAKGSHLSTRRLINSLTRNHSSVKLPAIESSVKSVSAT